MLEVRLSEIKGDALAFKMAVDAHAARLLAFGKEVGKPRPMASPMVEAALKRVQVKGQPDNYEADYTIIDDTPPPPAPLNLEDKKVQLHYQLSLAETEIKNKIMPLRKRRLSEMQYGMAVSKKEENRSPEEINTITSFLETNKKWSNVSLIAAQAESDIEDLTEDNIESWKLPDFESD